MNHKNLLTAGAILFNAFLFQAQTKLIQVKTLETGKWGYANTEGELVIPAEYEKCYPFSSNGLAVIYDTKERQYHFIDQNNKRLATTPEKFKIKDGMGFNVSSFNNHLFLVEVNGKWGYMNEEGKLVIEAVYDNGMDFNGGYASVTKGKQFLVINIRGEETVVEGAIDVKEFSEGLAPARKSDKKFGFVDTEGKWAVPAKFETVGYFSDGLAWAKTADGKLGYINKTGEWVIKPEFEAGKEFDPVSGLARVKKGEQWGYVDQNGKFLTFSDTESYGDFSEGLADGKKGGLRGFYNNKGEWVIEPVFQGVRDFHNGYAAAKQNDKWGLIDKKGKWVIEPKFDGIKDVTLIK